ncbi:hypothetical protein PZA11_002567 [Diplocarpon coronariae]
MYECIYAALQNSQPAMRARDIWIWDVYDRPGMGVPADLDYTPRCQNTSSCVLLRTQSARQDRGQT